MKDPVKTVQKTIDDVKIIEAQYSRLIKYIQQLQEENEELKKWKNDLLNSSRLTAQLCIARH